MDHTTEIEEVIVGTEFREGRWFPTRTDYVVTIKDHGRVVMTFHTGNKEEAEEIGPRLIEFLGF